MNHGLVGVSGVIKIALSTLESISFGKTLEIRFVGGKRYMCCHLSQGAVSASTATAFLSGHGDMYA